MSDLAKEILIVAGEASGDHHASLLIRELRQINPRCSFFGIGGNEMQDTGVNLLEHVDNVAVMGFTEVIKKYPLLRSVMENVVKESKQRRPARAILVDYPGFNLRLARSLNALDIPVTYYISPQLWAWREKRVQVMKECVDQILCIFPFEEEWYQKRGVEATFVGHPFIDLPEPTIKRNEFLECHGIHSTEKKIVSLMPGSRQQEVDRHLSVMLETIQCLQERGHQVTSIIGKAKGVKLNKDRLYDIAIEEEQPQLALRYADIAMIASGTATLEAALYGTPAIVVYRLSWVSWWLAQRLAKVSFVSMTNLIAEKEVLPELLQSDVTVENLVKEVESLLLSKSRRQEMIKELVKVRDRLDRPGAARRAAELVNHKLLSS